MKEFVIGVLELVNEMLTTAIAITAFSMLLFHLVRNLHDRVTRASASLLGCITVTYVADSLTSLELDPGLMETWLRLQWIGVAFLPAAVFHLADALLSTTGLISRGRRRATVRVLYLLSAAFAMLAAFTKTVLATLEAKPVYYMTPGPLFAVYTAYFIVACAVSMHIVWRARKRCLTTATYRRMTYLLAVFLTPALGLYPYSLLFEAFGNGSELPLIPLLIMFNLANFFVVAMLIFMSYPLSFFGANKPDRVVKTELLQFLLRGPFTASVVLAVMLTMPRLSEALHINGNSLLLLGSIGALLAMQWGITYSLPLLENWFIYTQDQREVRQLREISLRLLTRADITQLEEAVLAAICDHLRAPTGFIATINDQGASLERIIGSIPEKDIFEVLNTELPSLVGIGGQMQAIEQRGDLFRWQSYWLFPLRSQANGSAPLLGILGVWAERDPNTLEAADQQVLELLLARMAKVLADQRLQAQLFETLNSYITEMENMRYLAEVTRYGHLQTVIDSKDVHSALRDFWGGPRLLESRLSQLRIVQQELDKHDGNHARAIQSILTRAIDSLKPANERNMTAPEWLLYNILELRYMQGKKVRDVARQLFMSEPDFYRKQKIAIEELARSISEMERLQVEKIPESGDIWAADA